jgi:ABC-2 type transport system permease protein
VNGQHLRAFLWLRWRLRINQLRRGGIANTIILFILMTVGGFLALGLFAGFFLMGMFLRPPGVPGLLLYIWDGLIVFFLFFWVIGLLTDLQRSESLVLGKFLHLPVSLEGAFTINYLSSLLSVNLTLFLPACVGLILGLAVSRGPLLLLQLPLLAAFVLAITGPTYQLQGWLAALMTNKRRRRTVLFLATAALLLIGQMPNLINVFVRRQGRIADGQLVRKQADLERARQAGKIDAAEYGQREEKLREESVALAREIEEIVRIMNLTLPPGWLALGAEGLARGAVLPALLATAGLTLIGAASLWRAYRTTVRLYRGDFSLGKPRTAEPAPAEKPAANLLENKLPYLSEPATAIALGTWRALQRAPEARMMLLTPIVLVALSGSMFVMRPLHLPEVARPLLPFGSMAMVLLSMLQLVGNQLGFDRGGFRVYVLSPAPRRDVLLGKNLAIAPIPLGLGLAMTILLQMLFPMRPGYFLAVLPQLLSMLLIFCMLANWLSILAPLPIAAGSLRPTQMKIIPVVLHILFVMLFPIVLMTTLVPLGTALLLETLGGWQDAGLVCLVLSLIECGVVVLLYRLVLGGQGTLLQRREQKILQVVAARAE